LNLIRVMPAEGAEMRAVRSDLPDMASDVLARVREKRPRVHSITNGVAQAYTANVLLAFGALPSMTISPEEIGSFVERADALLVNLGTFDAERRAATDIAIKQAVGKSKPWVLDPVLIDRSPPRAEYARTIAKRGPAVVRLNAAEFETLARTGTDDGAVIRFAGEREVTIALTGAADLITDGQQQRRIGNGHEWMALVTAMGCAGSAMVAACLAVEKNPVLAAAAALLAIGVAGEIAAERSRGPGSFAIDIIDALHRLDKAALTSRAKAS
jgi:hydroxyethylthiazole kinase